MGNFEKLHGIVTEMCNSMQLQLIDFEIKGDLTKPLFLVFADNEEGITLGECQKLSRLIQDEIDIDDEFPLKYRLDVSSPGLDKPLVENYQLKRNIGKNVGFTPLSNLKKKITGKLLDFDDDTITVDVDKGKITPFKRTEIGDIKIQLQW